MALQGNIDSFSVVDVLRLLGSSGKTGRLLVEGDGAAGSLWLVNGMLAGATFERDGSSTTAADPAEVLFEVMRFVEGAFVFEADVRAEGPDDTGTPASDVGAVIDAAEAAMEEWTSITDLVASPRSALTLAADLPTPTVEVDRAGWRMISAIAGGAATCDDLADAFGWSELATMRQARDLVANGLVTVGGEMPRRPIAPTITDDGFVAVPLVEDSFDTAAPGFEGEPFAATPLADDPFGAEPLPDAPASASSLLDGALGGPAPFDHGQLLRNADPAPAADTAVPPPIGHLTTDPVPPAPPDPAPSAGGDGRSELFAIFGSVDPFAADRPAPAAAEPGEPETGGDGAASAEDPADDLARQLAMLSPRAAEAVASADSGGSLEDAERARVARFLGSV